MPACKYCRELIHFDPARKSESGKYIPLQDYDDEPHNCPENPYNAGGGSGRGKGMDGVDATAIENAITNMEDKIDKLNKNMLKMILAVQTVQKRIEGQMPLTFGGSASESYSDSNTNPLGEDSDVKLSS